MRSSPTTRCAAARERGASATINEKTAQKLLAYPVTYLDAATWDGIMARDLLAARLWVWLEGEHIREEWRWSLFPDSRQPVVLALQPKGRRTTPVAHLLTIDTWSRRRKVVERVRAACTVVMEVDPRYELLAVEPAVGDRGNYVLRCRRSGRRPAVPESATPSELESAWHAVSPLRRPSIRQLAVLRELTSEWGIARVVDALSEAPAGADPFRCVVEAADRWRTSREEAWDQAKADEIAVAPEVLQRIRERVAERAAAVTVRRASDPSAGPQSIEELLR